MILDQWSKLWGIPAEAITHLRQMMGIYDPGTRAHTGAQCERDIQAAIRLEASRSGCRLWRNNVGATTTPEGSFIRFGLANESKNVNKILKSADLIGIRPVRITPAMVGATIGQFLSREVKDAHWRYRGTDRERAQLAWAELIISLGGDASFTTGIL